MTITLDEEELIHSAKNGDNDAMKKIIDIHSGICIDMYKKYINPAYSAPWLVDDIQSSKDYIIYNSISSFDKNKGSKFSTWLANQTKYYCLNKLNKYKKMPKIQEIPENQNYENLMFEELSNFNAEKNKAGLMEDIFAMLSEISDKKIKTVIEKKYLNDSRKIKSFTEIAKEMNVSIQTVINWHNKFIDTARKKMNNSLNQ
jgi:DNA-directed RNA polymerase specialized sigma subunit